LKNPHVGTKKNGKMLDKYKKIVYIVTMYVKKTKRKYKNKTYQNYMLVEAIHTKKGPRQKVICSLGDLHPRSAKEWLKLAHKVEDALVRQGNLFDNHYEDDPEVQQILNKIQSQSGFEHQHQQQAGQVKKKENINVNVNIDVDRDVEHDRTSDSDSDEIISVVADKVYTEKEREAGAVHAGIQFWHKLELDKILQDAGLNPRTRRLTCAMVMNRLISPKSERAMPNWIRNTALDDILGEDFSSLCEDALYRNLDRLYPKRAMIESALAENERTLFNLDHTIYLYDLTSTYFEGAALSNPKARRGYSRDKRPDCTQVVIGLVVNRDGFPLCHEIFAGNHLDRKTLGAMLDTLDARVGLSKGQTIVVDRGMSYDDNLEEIKSRGLNYIVATRQSERDQWLWQFEADEDYEPVIRSVSPNNLSQQKTRVNVKLKYPEDEDEVHVLCLSEGRKHKDRGIREKKEKKLLEDLRKLQKRIKEGKLKKEAKIGEAIGRLKERYPRVARYYKMEYNAEEKKFEVERDEERLSKAEKLDGSYLLKSNRKDLTAEEAWRIYSLLTRAENAFRNMKSPLEERPIFHQLGNRVDTHIFLCILAYHLLVAIEKTLLDKQVHTSWATVRDILSTHQISTVVLPTSDGSELRIRQASKPEPHHMKIYDLLGVDPNIIKPVKTWIKKKKNRNRD
jgi:transposase